MAHDHNLRKRHAVADPPNATPNRQKRARVYRLKNGLVSLLKTPPELVPITKRNAETPLLRLPAEIRNKIFEYALGGNLIEIVHTKRSSLAFKVISKTSSSEVKAHLLLSLLTVCRQIYYETATLAYSCNSFSFDDGDVLQEWCQGRKRAQLDAVETIVLNSYVDVLHLPVSTYTTKVPGLRTVVLWISTCPLAEEGDVSAPGTVTGTSNPSIEYRWDLRWVRVAMDVLQHENPIVQIKVE